MMLHMVQIMLKKKTLLNDVMMATRRLLEKLTLTLFLLWNLGGVVVGSRLWGIAVQYRQDCPSSENVRGSPCNLLFAAGNHHGGGLAGKRC